MTTDEKKVYMLLHLVIFHYHGLDDEEEKILDQKAEQVGAHAELEWANDFISTDYLSAFDRARDYLTNVISKFNKEKRIQYLDDVWNANSTKGYITEMEAQAMIKLAMDWEVDEELLERVREKG